MAQTVETIGTHSLQNMMFSSGPSTFISQGSSSGRCWGRPFPSTSCLWGSAMGLLQMKCSSLPLNLGLRRVAKGMWPAVTMCPFQARLSGVSYFSLPTWAFVVTARTHPRQPAGPRKRTGQQKLQQGLDQRLSNGRTLILYLGHFPRN